MGLLIGPLLASTLVKHRIAKRRKQFEAALPDALGLIASSLTAGHTFLRAIQMMCEESPPPLSEEFSRLVSETRLGDPVVDALDRMAQRLQIRDLDWVVQAIRIQQQVGGRLADLLHTLADFIRAREEVRREVAVLTAEGRISAWVLTALAPFMAFAINFVSPDYMKPMFQRRRADRAHRHGGDGGHGLVHHLPHDKDRGIAMDLMILLPVFLAIAGATAVAVGLTRARPAGDVGKYLQDLDENVTFTDEFERKLQDPFIVRVVRPLGTGLASSVGRLTPRNYLDQTHRKLLLAGLTGTMRAEEFVVGQLAATAACTLGADHVHRLRPPVGPGRPAVPDHGPAHRPPPARLVAGPQGTGASGGDPEGPPRHP